MNRDEQTITLFGAELRDRLLAGVKQLNDSVSSTLGPAGRTVLIKDYIIRQSLRMMVLL